MNIGNKATSLMKLKKLNVLVPNFLIIDTSYFKRWRSGENISEEIKNLLIKNGIPTARLSYAIRSSCTKEDSQRASFAGLFDTFLNIQTQDEIVESIFKCWKSTRTEKTLSYCQKKNINSDELEMAVIVQEFIEGELSGVLFSLNPMNGHENEMLLEVVQGRGEALVSGHVNPNRYVLDAITKKVKQKTEVNSLLNQIDQIAFDKIIFNLIEAAKLFQGHFRSPQDIEFTYKNGDVYYLQSRPITFFQFKDFTGEWTTADFRDGGVSSSVVSPVMWSLYGNVFSYSLSEYFIELGLLTRQENQNLEWFKVFFAKPYWNLELTKKIQMRLPGFNERAFDKDMAIYPTYDGDGVVTGWDLKRIFTAIPVLLKITSGFKTQELAARKLIAQFATYEEKYKNLDWTSLTSQDLIRTSKELYQDYFYVETTYFKTIYNASNAKMFLLDDLKKYQKKDSSIEYSELIKNIENLSVLKPMQQIKEIVALIKQDTSLLEQVIEQIDIQIKKYAFDGSFLFNYAELLKSHPNSELSEKILLAVEKYFSDFYYHSTKELDLRVPRWSEQKYFFWVTIVSYLKTNEMRSGVLSSSNPSLDKIERIQSCGLYRLTPWIKKSFQNKLSQLKLFLWLREEVRDKSTRMYYFIRKLIVFLSDKYNTQDLLFYLKIEEILELIEKPESLNSLLIEARKVKLYANGFETFKNPNELGDKHGIQKQKIIGHLKSNEFQGIACSPGKIQGKARVLNSINESHLLQPGEIMVVPYTDPGWTPLFGLAAGVVTETGGLLSHAALISREYAIPAVLSIAEITNKVQSGQVISVDGNIGRVTIVSQNHETSL